jgi:uncharacterized protein YgbK (DUF1537 family)
VSVSDGEIVNKQALFASLPPVWPEPLLDAIRGRIDASGRRLVILDDDPTGAQTSHDVPVLTQLRPDLLDRELQQSRAFFLLTNTRAMTGAEAMARSLEIGTELREAAHRSGYELAVASRGDSTLRGHFPEETDAFAEAWLGDSVAHLSCILAPYFAEGGRFTIGDVHYVQQGEFLLLAAQTEFARDRVFGYKHSHLPSWVEEKTQGRVRASDVVSVSIDDLRLGGPEVVAAQLKAVPQGSVVIVNAADDRDVEVFVLGLLDAEASGGRFLYRTAASFVRIRAGIGRRPLLTSGELRVAGTNGGLAVVGSYIEKSSEQLHAAVQLPGVQAIELDVEGVLSGGCREAVRSAADATSKAIAAGEDVILFTTRGQRTGASDTETLAIAQRVSSALCDVVAGVTARPRFLLAKGGNTASDIAVRALGVRRAITLGQIQPGVPVWQLGSETRFDGLRYVIYPGNVGAPDGVADAIRTLRGD